MTRWFSCTWAKTGAGRRFPGASLTQATRWAHTGKRSSQGHCALPSKQSEHLVVNSVVKRASEEVLALFPANWRGFFCLSWFFNWRSGPRLVPTAQFVRARPLQAVLSGGRSLTVGNDRGASSQRFIQHGDVRHLSDRKPVVSTPDTLAKRGSRPSWPGHAATNVLLCCGAASLKSDILDVDGSDAAYPLFGGASSCQAALVSSSQRPPMLAGASAFCWAARPFAIKVCGGEARFSRCAASLYFAPSSFARHRPHCLDYSPLV